MAAKKYIQLLNGKLAQKQATIVSAGAGNEGDIPALDSSGRLDVSVLPAGVGPDVAVIVASEGLAAGDYVNIWDDAGTPKARLADNSNGRDAHGFVKTAFLTAASATVYFEGANDDLSGLTPGGRVYLGVAGGVTQTPPVAPAANISQLVGYAIASTIINTDIDDCIGLI